MNVWALPRHAIAAAILAAATGSSALGAEGVTLNLRRHGAAPGLAVTGTVTAQPVTGQGPALTFPLPAAAFPLPPGDWFLSVHIDGEWSEQRLVSIAGTPQTVDLDTFPLARVTAKVTLPSGKDPRELLIYFHRVGLEDITAPSEGSVACEVVKGSAGCQLPAGAYDLAFRVPGFVSRYRWNVALTSQTPFNAGTLQFVPGSTLSGRVELPPQDRTRLDRISVVVRPVAVPGANAEARHRNESARVTAHPTRRGLFAFDLPPGQFTVQASYEDLISDEVTADISAGHEALLRQPLRLQPKRSVTVQVHPHLDPWSKPWTIELARIDNSGYLLSERSLRTALDGSCRFPGVLPGRYRITAARSGDQTWASQVVDVDGDTTFDLPVKAIRVTGTIRLGSRPLAATARVSASETGGSAFIRSKADGTFLAALPAPEHDTWDEVEVRADHPALKRTLENVSFKRHDDGSAELNLDLPSGTITGTVVDEMGRPAAPAMVDVVMADGSIQQADSPDGSFTVTALGAGRYRLRAATAERESIDTQDVMLGDDSDASADVVLPIVPVAHLRGVIRAPDGPAMGAVLYATRPSDHTRPVILSRVDPDGRFDIRFPAGTSEVAVAINAPGFAFRLARTTIGTDEQTFGVEQNGGALSVDAPAVQTGLRPYLIHGGASLSATAIAYIAGVPFLANLPDRVRYQIPSAEPGPYSLCWISDGATMTGAVPPCINGVLAPNGALTLKSE
jgi:hypothetical protein